MISFSTGSEKAQEGDFDDLRLPITYRHILSLNLGVKDPLRVIALCDSDAFYAACEMVRLGVNEDTPLVVLQWDSIIAVNYAARKYGISRMDKVKEAKKRCPHLRVVHVATYKEGEKEPGYWDHIDTNTHKVSLDYYRRESMKIAALFKEKLPGCEIEKASIDEAFIDFTKPVRELLLQRYPYLAQVSPDAPHGIDSPLPPPPTLSWTGLGTMVPIEPVKSDVEHPPGEPDVEKHDAAKEEEFMHTWHDVALSIAADLMGKARDAVRKTLGYSTSAGIARNKSLAKLVASYRKPQGQTILRNSAIPNYLKPLSFRKIRFLGGKLGKALAQEYDISTVGDLLKIGLNGMQQTFGEEAIWVYELIRGLDRSEVKDKGSALNKSMLASKNLPMPITKPSEGYHWIRVLAAELALRLTDARTVSPNLWPKTIVLYARKDYESSRSKQAPFPFTRNITTDVIAAAGDKLWNELVGNQAETQVSSVQLAFTGISFSEPGQQTIEGFLNAEASSSKRRREEDDGGGRPTRVRSEDDSRPPPIVGQLSDGEADGSFHDQSSSFTCERCEKTLQLPIALATADAALRDMSLATLRLEHEDFHFAEDLAKTMDTTIKITPSKSSKPGSNNSKSNTKTKRKTQGIEKFFVRR